MDAAHSPSKAQSMTNDLSFSVPLRFQGRAWIDARTYRREYDRSLRDPGGPIARPDLIQWAPNLPKTRSGKIMRRVLRRIAAGDAAGFGDTSTLADPAVIEGLVQSRRAMPACAE